MPNQKWRHLFTQEEWERAHQLSKDLKDAEEKKSFWGTILEKKEKDPTYNVFDDFPVEPISMRVCGWYRSLKKEEPPMMETPQKKELKELGELFSRLISEGKHLSDKEAS